MEKFKENFVEIYKKKHGLFWLMVLLMLLSVALLVFSLITLKPSSSVVKVGYGDIGRYQGGEWTSMANSGGYHDGSWVNMLAYPLLALMFGVLHNFLAIKLYEKRGEGMAKIWLITSIGLVLGTFLVLVRLLGEG